MNSPNKTFYSKYYHLIWLFICLTFITVGGITTYFSKSTLSPLWRIAQCNWKSPGEDFVMAGCDPIISPFYRLGALYLDIEPKLTKALREADIVITGNSRTLYTFALFLKNNPIEQFFAEKHLKAFIIAEEGSGFRFRKLVLEKLNLHPKMGLINTEDLAADLLEDDNKELIFNPDRFKFPFKIIHFAVEMQQAICTSNKNSFIMNQLQSFYCHGTIQPTWRSLNTGVTSIITNRVPTNKQQITMVPDQHIGSIDIFRRRMQIMLKSKAWSNSCIIFYEIPNPNQFYEVSTILSKEANKPFIFPEVNSEKNYFVFDGSHMEVDTAIHWTKEFFLALEPQLNECIKKQDHVS